MVIRYIALGFNVLAFIFTIVAVSIPWYSISFKGTIDNDYYDTTASFGFTKYKCDYINTKTELQSSVKKQYGIDAGSECYPIVPPTANLFGMGIGLIIAIFFICFSLLPSLHSIVLKAAMFRLPKFGFKWVKITVFLISLVTLAFYIVGIKFSSGINTGLQSYGAEDKTSTSSDKFTAKLCEDLWCTSFKGSGSSSPLAQDIQSNWGPASGFYLGIISCALIFISGILTLFISPQNRDVNHLFIKSQVLIKANNDEI